MQEEGKEKGGWRSGEFSPEPQTVLNSVPCPTNATYNENNSSSTP